MTPINLGRVFIGGLVAGVVANVIDVFSNLVILKDSMAAELDRLHIDPAVAASGSVAATWILVDFILGVLVVLTYAAIRPRFGPGPKTALLAGFLLYVAVTVVLWGFTSMDVIGRGVFVENSLTSLVAVALASLAGCALYKEA
jgi:hypothetical protein